MNKVSIKTRNALVKDIARLAREKYVLPEKGEQIAQALLAYLKQGRYEGIEGAHTLADKLTADLFEISQDKHWEVHFDSSFARAIYAEGESEEDIQALQQGILRANCGIRKVELLPGNIGYMDIRGLAWIGFPGAGDIIVSALQLVSHCDALILDLRHNHGGEVETLQLYISYFVKDGPKLYDSFFYRQTNETQQLWTLPYIPGRLLADAPIYALTSSMTASGGEAFAYILQGMKRAKIIGEVTAGAGHTQDMEILQEHFQVEYPSGRSISPFTGTDWEGVGVQPDVSVPAVDALKTAHHMALEELLAACKNDRIRRELEWDRESAKVIYEPAAVAGKVLEGYAGQYGDRCFCVVDGCLGYIRQNRIPARLTALAANRFMYADTIKFEFSPDEGGRAGVTVSYRDGRPDVVLLKYH